MNEIHNVGRLDQALRLVLAAATILLARELVQSGAQRVFIATMVMMPFFAYLLVTSMKRVDVVYTLWDIDTTQPRGHRWTGHHGDAGAKWG